MKRSRRAMSEKEKVAAWVFKLAAVGKPCVVCKQMWRPMEGERWLV